MPMPSRLRRPPARLARAAATLVVLAAAVAACGSTAPSSAPTASAAASHVASSTAAPSAATASPTLTQAPPPTPILTATPAASAEPTDPPDIPAGGTTRTDWGVIMDQVPDGFPVYPGAKPAELPDGPSSGTWLAGARVDDVAAWYQGALADAGYTNRDLSSPLEDGSRILDTVSDLPECRIQTTFRPAGGSTMISVLFGAGCSGLEG